MEEKYIDKFLDMLEKILGSIPSKDILREELILECKKEKEEGGFNIDIKYYMDHGGLNVELISNLEKNTFIANKFNHLGLSVVTYGYTNKIPERLGTQWKIPCLYFIDAEGAVQKDDGLWADIKNPEVRYMTVSEIDWFLERIHDYKQNYL